MLYIIACRKLGDWAEERVDWPGDLQSNSFQFPNLEEYYLKKEIAI